MTLPTFDDVYGFLSRCRLNLASEAAAQAGLERLLQANQPGWIVGREHRLSGRDRPDFVIRGVTPAASDGAWIVAELKAAGAQLRPTLRQLHRYAEHACVDALILVTNRAMPVPAEVEGKPLRAVNLARAWL